MTIYANYYGLLANAVNQSYWDEDSTLCVALYFTMNKAYVFNNNYMESTHIYSIRRDPIGVSRLRVGDLQYMG